MSVRSPPRKPSNGTSISSPSTKGERPRHITITSACRPLLTASSRRIFSPSGGDQTRRAAAYGFAPSSYSKRRAYSWPAFRSISLVTILVRRFLDFFFSNWPSVYIRNQPLPAKPREYFPYRGHLSVPRAPAPKIL